MVGMAIPNRTRNDNVSGRVPMSAKPGGTDPAVEDAIARVAAALRRGAWDEARALVEKLAASAAG